MTIATTANKIVYAGNGATTVFSFTFPALAAADILAYYTDSAGVITTLVQGSGTTQYQVSLNSATAPNPTAAGGTVTYNPSGTPIASGTTLTILRTASLVQATSLANQGTLYPSVIEQALDTLLAQIQQVNELIGRQITVAVSDSSPAALPPAAQRASKYMAFDSNGDPTASSASPSSTPVSSTMAGFVNAASLAAARTLLGLGNIAVETIGSGLQDDGSGNVRANLEIVTADTINQTVTLAYNNTQRVATGPITYTLPRANTLWNGFGFKIENLQAGGDVTFAINVNDTFQNYVSGTSFIVGRGASIEIWTDAAASGTWYYRLQGGKKLVGDAAYTITPADRTVLTSAALTASRIWTLPGASTVKAGVTLNISDESNAVTSANTIVVTAAGADTIVAQGTTVTTMTMRTAGDSLSLVSDGVSKWVTISVRFRPTIQKFTAGVAATYTPPNGVSHIRVRLIGGGGGGGAATTNNGTVGNDTTFQVNSTGTAWTAKGGSGGALGGGSYTNGGTGGSDGTTGTLIERIAGGYGGSNVTASNGGAGGASVLGGSRPNSVTNTAGQAAIANSGSGGSGGSNGAAAGAGGGSGEYVEFWAFGITTATYTVGAAANGGAAGGAAGGNGAAGVIIIEEYYF